MSYRPVRARNRDFRAFRACLIVLFQTSTGLIVLLEASTGPSVMLYTSSSPCGAATASLCGFSAETGVRGPGAGARAVRESLGLPVSTHTPKIATPRCGGKTIVPACAPLRAALR